MVSSEALEENKPEGGAPVRDKEEEKKEGEEEAEQKEQTEGRDGGGEVLKESERDAPMENGELEESGEKERGGKRAGKRSTKKKPRKEAKEPVTPIERPTRERKIVKRYSAPSTGRSTASKVLLIEKGRGTQLKDIPNVAFKLSKRKADDNLQMLHTILFGKKTTTHKLKRNIGQFSGYVWVENEQEKQRARIKDKLDKCFKEKLLDFCDVLNIQINKANVRKEELSAKLLEFLESPHATTDVVLADKEQKVKKWKRKASMGQNVRSGESSTETSSKKQKQKPQSGDKRERTLTVEGDHDDKDEPSDTKNFSHEDGDSDTMPKEGSEKEDSDSEEQVEQKSSHKSSPKRNVKNSSEAITKEKSTPLKNDILEKSVKTPEKATKKASGSAAKKGTIDGDDRSSKSKVSAAKKQKVEKKSQKDQSVSGKGKASAKKESSKPLAKASAAREGKGKKRKKAREAPTREEMHAVVIDVLKKVDFNTATLSDILRQLGTHFGMDLMERKAEVKAIITDVINSMSDDEEEEAEENSESEDDAGEGHDTYSDSDSDDAGKGDETDSESDSDDTGEGNGTDSDA